MRKAVLPLFFVSGSAGLIYEVAWTRAFGVVFGNTIFAVSTVLTAFMLGLAVGSWLFGRIADKSSQPLKLYAFLQLVIGAYAFAFPTVLGATDILYRWFFRSFHPSFYPLSLFRFALSIVILLLPTALMGGTLPVLSRLWARRTTESRKKTSEAHIGQSVGLLYAINTFGAVAGSFLSGYLLIRVMGVSNTVYLAASANVLVGVLAFILPGFISHWRVETSAAKQSGRTPRKKQKQSKRESGHVEISRIEGGAAEELDKKRQIVLVAVGLAGFCALALEVLWTRVLVFVLGTTVYAFACMLTCFLLGIALGSFLCSRLFVGRIKNPIFTLGVVEFLVALSVLASIGLLAILWHIDFMLARTLFVGGFWKEVAAHFIDASVVLLVPTVLMGAAFPIAVKICARSWKAVGKRVGEVYASNTVGCVIGSFAAGFVMVPLLGLRDSFLLVVAIQLFVATAVIFFSEKRRAVFSAPTAVASLALLITGILSIPREVFVRTMNTYHHPSQIVYIKDDATGTVTVHDIPDEEDRIIAVDGVNVAGIDLMLRTTQKLQGYVPLLVHNNPRKVLQIGFGSGETSGVGLAFGVEQYSIVEICPGVFEAGKFFKDINKGSYQDPRLNKIIMDGKNFVKLTDKKFDVIMNDSTYPGTTGSSALYTYDHFKQCRQRLSPGGVLSCWLPLDLRPVDFQMILRSFQAVMPHSSLWMANNCLNKHAVLMGTLSPTRIDFARVRKLVERPDISSDLAVINIHSVYDLLDCFVVGEDGLRRMASSVPLNTDDKPLLEFGAAIKRDIEECWMVVLGWLSEEHYPVADVVVNTGETEEESLQVQTTLKQYFTGTGHALRGLLGILEGNPAIMEREFENARKANPQDRDVEACLVELRAEIKALVRVVGRMQRKAPLRARLAKRYLLLRDYERAAEEYVNFVRLEPGNAAGWNNLGICYNKLEQYTKAVGAFESAIKCNAGLVSAYFNLGDVYGQLGNFAASSRNYEKALSLSPHSQTPYIYDKLARAYFMQKEYTLALGALEKALELASNDPALQNYLQGRKEAVMRAAERP
ncbi:MAG: fused MFS/spermidine synthase [Planctomycetota bacterium]